MPWTPPSDAVEVTKGGWTPPTDAVEVKPQASMPDVDPMGNVAGISETPIDEVTGPPIGFKELMSNPQYFKVISDYKAVRFNEPYKEGTDKEAYVKDFMSKMRENEMNVVFGAVPELNWMRNAKPEDLQKSALAQKVYENTASAFSKEGQEGFRPYWDTLKAIATDPTTYAGFFVGKAALGAGTKLAVSAAKQKALSTSAGVAGEAAIGAASNVVQQKIRSQTEKGLLSPDQQKTYVEPDLSMAEVGVSALISGVFGGAEGYAAARNIGKTQAGQEIDKYLKKKNITPSSATDPVEDTISKKMASEVDMKAFGKQVLDELGPNSPVTDAKIATEMSRRAVRVAMHVIEQDPTFALKKGEKISTAIGNVFSNVGQINDQVLENAIRRAGLTPEEFAAANKMTVTDAAAVMQQYSVAARLVNRLREIDPDFDKRMENIYGKNDNYVSPIASLLDGVKWTEKQSKAFVTSGIDTTLRNVAGTNIGLTVKAAADVIDGFLYTGGVALKKAGKIALGKPVGDLSVRKAAADSVKDAWDTFFYMKNQGLAAEVTDKLLENNPSIRNHMLSALQDTDKKDVSKVAQWVNTLNAAQDTFFRRSVFTASVERQLRDQGIDLYADVLAKNKTVPVPILSRAADDSLKATFSYMPKQQAKAAGKSIESMAEGGANLVVKTIENTPFASLAIPFPRFMANAMAFQYRYSPLGAIGAGEDAMKAIALRESNPERSTQLITQARIKTAQAVVGSAALAAAYHYRMENPDSKWYEVKQDNGTTMDIRSVFPLGPYFAIADLFARNEQGLPVKSKEAMEAVTGMKTPAGTQNVLLDQIFDAFDSEKSADAFAVAAGKLVGDFFGRFEQPFVVKNIYDFFDLFRPDGSIARDPNVIDDTKSGMDQFTQAATQRMQSKLPVLKEDLPEAIPRLREGPVVREGEFFSRLVGFRSEPLKSVAEREIAKLDIDPYRLYGGASGDKQYDRMFIENANKLVIPRIESIVRNSEYQKKTPLEQRIALAQSIRDMTQKARDITANEMKAKDISRVYKMRFDKLPQDIRMQINEDYAKEHNGVRLDEANDYIALDKYEAQIKALRFASGGIVKKIAGALVQEGAQASKKNFDELMMGMQKAAEKPVQEAVDPELVRIANDALKGKPSPSLSKAVSDVSNPEQMPMPSAPKSSAIEHYKFSTDFFKGFPEEEVVKAEQQLAAKYGDIAPLMEDYPDEFANELAAQVQGNMKFKNKEFPYLSDPENPWSWKGLSSVGIKSKKKLADEEALGYTIATPADVSKKKVSALYSDEAIKGKISQADTLEDRNSIISQIREYRSVTFKELRDKEQASGVEDIVIGKTQGEFRAKFGHEVDPLDKKDVNAFFDLAKKQQALYNNYKKRYANKAEVTLFHGSYSTPSILKAGSFTAPQKHPKYHNELRLGAPSFTRDINLGLDSGDFGGSDLNRYLTTSIPYADYKFLRVNLSHGAYDNADINTIAKTITGDPYSVRPLGLPRSEVFKEAEDAIVEADKLMIKPGAKDVEAKLKGGGTRRSWEEYTVKRISLLSQLSDISYASFGEMSNKELYSSYDKVREFLKLLSDKAYRTDPSLGIGQRYHKDLKTFPVRTQSLTELATSLERIGAKQKAAQLTKLVDELESVKGGTIPEQTKAASKVLQLTDKFARGGLVSRRQ